MIKSIKSKITSQSFKCLFTGLIELLLCCQGYGIYPTIEYTLRQDNYFNDLSEEQQEQTYARIYSLVLIFNQFNKICLGVLIDWKGIWFARSVVHLEMITGLIILIVMTAVGPSLEILAYLGFPIYLGSGIGLVFTSIRLTDLDKDNRGLWNSALGSAIALGQQFYILYRPMSATKRVWFWVMFLLFEPVPILRTFLCTPRSNVLSNGIGWKTRFDSVEKKSTETSSGSESTGQTKKFLKTFFSLNLILMFLWLICVDIRFQSFTIQYQPWLRWATNNTLDEVTFYTDANVYINLLAIPLAVLNGKLFDIVTKFFENNKNFNYNKQPAMALTCYIWMAFNGICGIFMSFISTFQNVGWQTFLMLIFFLGQSMTQFSTRNLYILCMVEKDIFGKVMGFTNVFLLISAFLAPVLTDVVNEVFAGNFVEMELILLGVSAMGVLFPFLNYVWTFYLNEEYRGKIKKMEEK